LISVYTQSYLAEKALGKGQVCPQGGDGHPEDRCGLQLAPTGNPAGNEYVYILALVPE